MKSPPADIFVWGVHPETTLDDIVSDLAASDIKIETKDIQKKSKPDANMTSYKISIPASDLQKALEPDIWPLRVKVREYIYYSNKPRQQDGRARQSGQQVSNHLQQQVQSHPQQQQHGQVGQTAGIDTGNFVLPTHNQFDALSLLGAACL